VNQALTTIYVTPSNYQYATTTGASGNQYSTLALTPAAYIGTMFQDWRGVMCYRYKVLASQYHRGKLRIYYDSNDLTSTPPEGLLPCTVLDLAEASEVVIKVPMATSVPWL
jgi:hypothetical protein